MATTPSAAEKARKVKNLLASYYTDNETDRETDAGSFASPSRAPSMSVAPSPAMSIAESDYYRTSTPLDASYFNSEAHLRRMIKETRLGALVDQHRALAAEVGALDSDMQTLVYENYNKFIVATDIIRAMDGAMNGLDDRLHQLESLISGAVARSEAVNGTLEQRQAAIMELKQTRELLRQLQALLEVPRRLKAALNHGDYDIVVDIYAEVSPVLEKHGNRKALRKIAAEVETYRREAAEWLRQQLHSCPESAAETIQMIAKLGESTASLMDDFLGCQRRRLSAALESGEKALSEADTNEKFGTALAAMNERFVPELARTATLFAQLFEPSERPKLVSESREWLLRYMTVVRRALDKAATASVAAAAGLDISGRRSKNQESPKDASVDPSQAGFSEDWGAENLIRSLDLVRQDLIQLESPLPELSSRDKVSELLGNLVRQHVALSFSAIEARLALQLGDIKSELSGKNGAEMDAVELRKKAQLAMSELPHIAFRGLEHALRGISHWNAHEWTLEGWKEMYATLLQAQVSNWLVNLPRRCLVAAGLITSNDDDSLDVSRGAAASGADGASALPPFSEAWKASKATVDEEAPALYYIVLAVFCSCGNTRIADRAEDLLSQNTGGGIGLAPGWVGDAITAASLAASKLLETYRAALASNLTSMLVSSVNETSWGSLPEAKAPRPVCTKLLDAVAQAGADMQAAEQEASSIVAAALAISSGGGGSRGHHRRQSTGSSVLEGSVTGSALGSTSATSSGNVPWTSRTDVIATAVQAAIHSEASALRKHTLSRSAFQQVQLDCHFLRPQLQRMVENAPGGDAALNAVDEMLVVAAERCGEPVMLEPAALDRMVAAFQAQGLGRRI